MDLTDRERFEKFLSGVDLAQYRLAYRPIKIVEMDLDKNIQILDVLYRIYWIERNFLSYEKFYEFYLKEKKEEIEAFRKKIGMCENCFYKGLPARIFRTWASIITQIQAGYVAETAFGIGSVEMSEDLDRKGADFRITHSGKALNCQIKKETRSRKVRKEKRGKVKLEGKWINVNYFVPSEKDMAEPIKKKGGYKAGFLRFNQYGYLEYLKNGFVIFNDKLIGLLKNNIGIVE